MRRGRGIVEYGLIIGLVAVVAIAVHNVYTGGGRPADGPSMMCHKGHFGECHYVELTRRVQELEKLRPQVEALTKELKELRGR